MKDNGVIISRRLDALYALFKVTAAVVIDNDDVNAGFLDDFHGLIYLLHSEVVAGPHQILVDAEHGGLGANMSCVLKFNILKDMRAVRMTRVDSIRSTQGPAD